MNVFGNKNGFDGFISRLDQDEESNSELENRSTETSSTEPNEK